MRVLLALLMVACVRVNGQNLFADPAFVGEAATPCPTNLTYGLVAWWTMDDALTSSGSGNVKDSSGQGNHGTEHTTCSSTNGLVRQAIRLDGANGYMDFGSAFNFTTEPFSLCGWFLFDSYTTDAANGPFCFYKGEYQVAGYYVDVNTAGTVNVGTSQSGANQVSSSTVGVWVLGVWKHLVVTRSAASVRIFVDGADVTSIAGSHVNPSSSSDPFQIGCYLSVGSPYVKSFYGAVDDARVYNRALTTNEVRYLYNNGKAGRWAP